MSVRITKKKMLQDVVNSTRALEHLSPILINDNNIEDAHKYALAKNFEYFLLDVMDFYEHRLMVCEDMIECKDSTEAQIKEIESVKREYRDCLDQLIGFERLYCAIKADPHIIYMSTGDVFCKIKCFRYIKEFKLFLKDFHRRKKVFEETSNNPFNK